MKNLFKDTKAQTGGLIVFVIGIFVLGFFYVAFGGIMNEFETINNALMADSNMEYSQAHWDIMDTLFTYWWGVPIIIMLIFLTWIIRNTLNKESGYV